MTAEGFDSFIINGNNLNRIRSITIINKIQSQFLGHILKKICQICRIINHRQNRRRQFNLGDEATTKTWSWSWTPSPIGGTVNM